MKIDFPMAEVKFEHELLALTKGKHKVILLSLYVNKGIPLQKCEKDQDKKLSEV